MPVSADISEARVLLERAERESDPEQETRHIEEALLLLETADDPTPEEKRLIANLRNRTLAAYSHRCQNSNRCLSRYGCSISMSSLLGERGRGLTTGDPTLAANRQAFVAMWGPDALAAIEKGNAA